MKIIIQSQPHSLQRYNTVGDWYTDKINGNVRIYVSQMNNWRFELLVAIHEVVEAFLCLNDGVLEEDVTKFDKAFLGEDEPGDEPDAPYARQHCIATGIERILAALLGVKWSNYENAIERTSQELRNGSQTLGDA
jgi:hypothetical protein